MSATTPTLEFNDFQQRALAVPEELDLFLGGGRGGGKSYLLALLALRHVEQYGAAARILYVRRTYKGLADAELIMRSLSAWFTARMRASMLPSTYGAFRMAVTWSWDSWSRIRLCQVSRPVFHAAAD